MEPNYNPRDLLIYCSQGNLPAVSAVIKSDILNLSNLREGLNMAVTSGQIEIARFLFERGVDYGDLAWVAEQVTTNLKSAPKSVPVLDLLIEHGWNVKETGHKALCGAITSEPLVRWLIEHGADPALDVPKIAYPSNYIESMKTGINAAAQIGSIAVFDLLVKHGADPHKSIPLHVMAGTRQINDDWRRMVAHLLAIGFDINGSDFEQQGPFAKGTPLHFSVLFRVPEAAQYFLEKGADPRIKDQKSGLSALETARKIGAAEEFEDIFERAIEALAKDESSGATVTFVGGS